jgi:hypothetical protein
MQKKIVIIFEILFILVAFTYYTIKVIVPEFKEKYGSSDVLINTNKYKNLIEINVDNKVNFSYALSEDKEIYHIFFLDNNSTILYNQDIENTSISEGVSKTIKLLIENDYLKNTSIIKVTRYGDTYYSNFKNNFLKILKKYSLNTDIIEEDSTLEKLSEKLELDSNKDSSILYNLDLYSKEFTRSINNVNKSSEDVVLSNDNSRSLSDNIYKKIEEYKNTNNISNLDKDNTLLVINLIPADNSGKYYPTDNSWYYIKDNKIYAYIELTSNNKTYSYCYNGSIDLVKKGEC